MPLRAVRAAFGTGAIALIGVGLYLAMGNAADAMVALFMGAGVLSGIAAALVRTR